MVELENKIERMVRSKRERKSGRRRKKTDRRGERQKDKAREKTETIREIRGREIKTENKRSGGEREK